jgi:hypothetical protein
MSQKNVQLIIGRILTDEEFRLDFLERPAATLTLLRERGCELTAVEASAIVMTDRRLWQFGERWIDERLQRCRPACEEGLRS